MKESVIASDLTIEGKIIGSGHVRIAGRFEARADLLSMATKRHPAGGILVHVDRIIVAQAENVGLLHAAFAPTDRA